MKQRIVASFQANRLDEARILCRRLCQSAPADADSWYMLGVIEDAAGQRAEAADAWRRVLRLHPAHPEAHYNLGHALMQTGRADEAIEHMRLALQARPDFPEALVNLGTLLRGKGELDGAVECFRRALRINPGYALAHFNLGNALAARSLHEEAVYSYRNALRLDPAYAPAHLALGDSLRNLFFREEAATHFEQAARLDPRNPAAHAKLADVCILLGDYDEALRRYDALLALVPGDPEAIAGKVLAYDKKGDYAQALRVVEPYLREKPDNPALAIAFAGICRRVGRCDDAVAWLRRLLETDRLDPGSRAALHFSLGTVLDARKDYSEAFPHFARANALKAASAEPHRHEREMRAMMEFVNATLMSRLPRANNESDLPIFIVGMPRSGTSLVEQILASHPDVHGGGELPHVNRMVDTLPARLGSDRTYPYTLAEMTTPTVDALANAYLEQLRRLSASAARITDKMPHNFMWLGLIEALFPRARVVHCVRDPLDNCLSIFTTPGFNAHHGYAFDLKTLGSHYRCYRELMAHWKRVLTLPVLDVVYEDLVADQEGKTRELLEFCGLTWNTDCLEFHRSGRVVNTPSYDQVRQPIYTGSVARWKRYEDFLQPLVAALRSDTDT